jgi:hypothetical protein
LEVMNILVKKYFLLYEQYDSRMLQT